MKIVDCFMFYNELDILKIRLHEIYDVVDHIIIVEASKTHTGKSKPLYYSENKHLFDRYHDKIIHLVTDFDEDYAFRKCMNSINEHWYRENFQRECIQVLIHQLDLMDEDILIVTDADEIPSKQVIQDIRSGTMKIQDNHLYSIEMALYYYNIELTTSRKWYHPKIFNYFTYKNHKLLTDIRLSSPSNIIRDGGWHLSYFGDENFIKNKVESFAESIEYTEEGKNIDYLKDCIDKSILHFNKEQLIHIPLVSNKNVPSFFISS